MSLAAGEATLNPNNDVGSEGKGVSRAGSAVSFEDLDAPDFDAEKGARKKKEEKKPEPSKVKENDPRDDAQAKGPDKKAPKKEEKKEPESSGKDDDEEKAQPSEKKPKPKVHKFSQGETQGEVSGDAVFTIPVNGVKETVALQDLVNEYNGKKFYENQHSTLTSEKRKFEKERGDLNKTVTDFVERVNKDASSAWDWLAELNGKNPVDFKESMLRQQIKEILPLAKMSPEELEGWINQKKLEWREKRVTSKEAETTRNAETQAQTQKRRDAQEHFGLSDDDYQANFELAKKLPILKGADPAPAQVAYVHRWNKAADAVEKAVPDLAKHPKYDSIMHDLATTLLESPKMTQEHLETFLRKEFGDDGKENLRRASRNANKNANYDAEEPGSRTPKKKPQNGFESFDDLDD